MEFDWLNSILMGILTGAASVLPVSVEAHQRLLLKFMGMHEIPVLTALAIHLGVAAALYLCCLNHILKMTRASRLARIPKRKRKRPLDTRSLMDLSLLKTMLLPVVLAFFLYEKVSALVSNFIVMAAFLFVNGLLLYIPQFLPTSNKDCRTLSRVEGLLMGLGGGLFVVPGLSGVGTALSGASICGVSVTAVVSSDSFVTVSSPLLASSISFVMKFSFNLSKYSSFKVEIISDLVDFKPKQTPKIIAQIKN